LGTQKLGFGVEVGDKIRKTGTKLAAKIIGDVIRSKLIGVIINLSPHFYIRVNNLLINTFSQSNQRSKPIHEATYKNESSLINLYGNSYLFIISKSQHTINMHQYRSTNHADFE
jgi:hypothetical protein